MIVVTLYWQFFLSALLKICFSCHTFCKERKLGLSFKQCLASCNLSNTKGLYKSRIPFFLFFPYSKSFMPALQKLFAGHLMCILGAWGLRLYRYIFIISNQMQWGLFDPRMARPNRRLMDWGYSLCWVRVGGDRVLNPCLVYSEEERALGMGTSLALVEFYSFLPRWREKNRSIEQSSKVHSPYPTEFKKTIVALNLAIYGAIKAVFKSKWTEKQC